MGRIDIIKSKGWNIADKNKFVIEQVKCPLCGNHVLHMEKAQSNGTMMYKGFCNVCEYETRYLKHKSNITRRSASSQNKWASIVKQNDDDKCRICGSTEEIEAHHIIPVSIDKSLENNLGNGICLCKKHHKLIHKYMKGA